MRKRNDMKESCLPIASLDDKAVRPKFLSPAAIPKMTPTRAQGRAKTQPKGSEIGQRCNLARRFRVTTGLLPRPLSRPSSGPLSRR